ncbi:MAG: TVP38/TMEM64 family protein [Desulfovibrionaceae bacterium]|nr:TVP38/TMEM64 family protein [Desulfovibrionaceae bacterium]MBF0512702.1 TVP38/TMEM64 family protein [Desulfovibrionaceae bacterium]
MSGAAKKIGLAAAIAVLIALYFGLGLHRFLSLAGLQASRQDFLALYRERPVLVPLSYFALYVAVTGLSLPGAAALTLAAGTLFGFAAGSVLASFASTLGATLACALARTLLRDFARRRFASVWSKISDGLARDGAFYLFSLRLIPAFPFFAINVAMGLTDMPLGRFYLVSQLGMLPGTLFYVNAGVEIGKLTSPAGILSPGLLVSLCLLGIFPLLAKKALDLYRARRKT